MCVCVVCVVCVHPQPKVIPQVRDLLVASLVLLPLPRYVVRMLGVVLALIHPSFC